MRAARNISEGEHLSTMYTHALWGTIARFNLNYIYIVATNDAKYILSLSSTLI